MSDNQNFDFGKFVPGFDFLQNLAKGAQVPQMPNLANWIAPTLNLDELEKRIGELKAVHFWLDQNSKALGATIQALEVQKMTLATLKGMNFNMGEVANALKLKPAESMFGAAQFGEKAGDSRKAGAAGSPREGSGPTSGATSGMTSAASGANKSKPTGKQDESGKSAGERAAGVVDPLQWWGALTQQFQQIAATALKDAAAQSAVDLAKGTAGGASKGGSRTAGRGVGGGTRKTPAKRSAGKK